jgi:hypothetical protein
LDELLGAQRVSDDHRTQASRPHKPGPGHTQPGSLRKCYSYLPGTHEEPRRHHNELNTKQDSRAGDLVCAANGAVAVLWAEACAKEEQAFNRGKQE